MRNKYYKLDKQARKEQRIIIQAAKEMGERIRTDHEFGIQLLIEMGVLTKKLNRTKRYANLCIGRAPD